MSVVLVCPTRLKSGYPWPLPSWVSASVSDHSPGIGFARNLGAKAAIEKYRLEPEDWLVFVDDDTVLPLDSRPPPAGYHVAVPIYTPAWAGWKDDPMGSSPIMLVNVANALGLGPITVGSCIAVTVYAFHRLGHFPESDDLMEDVMFGLGVRAQELRWALWRTRAMVHRRYANDWMEVPW